MNFRRGKRIHHDLRVITEDDYGDCCYAMRVVWAERVSRERAAALLR